MSSTYTGLAAGGLKRQVYNNFRGVDFTGGDVSTARSPDALNMWRNYKNLGKYIETRPSMQTYLTESGNIYGLFYYEVNSVPHMIIHEGVSLIDYNMSTEAKTTIKANGMNPAKSTSFIMNNILFIKDGLNYYEYNGTTLSVVVGTIPNIAIHKLVDGQTEMIQEPNLLTDWVREQYIPDGTATDFYLSQKEIDDGLEVWDISNVTPTQIVSGFSVDKTNGIVTFSSAPAAATSASLEFKYKKTSDGRTSADKCPLAVVFDNRVFMGGSTRNPNLLIWSGLNDARYIANTSYSTQGNDEAVIKAIVPGNNALWVFKEPSHNNTTIFYNVPYEVYDAKLGQTIKTYACSHSSISTGCVATGINFNDDIVFFSNRGMEGISSDITTEQVIGHRSTLVDNYLLTEPDYKKMILVEWEGYLLTIINDKVYLADSHQRVSNNDHIEYEWFYWSLGEDISSAVVINDVLYLGTKTGQSKDSRGYLQYIKTIDGVLKQFYYDERNQILYDSSGNKSDEALSGLSPVNIMFPHIYKIDGTKGNLRSWWTTKQDDFDYPQLLKTTNKKGFKTEMIGEQVSILTKIDNNDFEELATLNNTKGYVVTKIKKKKWNKLQLKFTSSKPFGLYESVLEAYIGSYVKRS